MSAALQWVELSLRQSDISTASVESALNKNARELMIVGATMSDLVEMCRKQNDTVLRVRSIGRQNTWAEANRHLSSCELSHLRELP
jgi:hypothetical protein